MRLRIRMIPMFWCLKNPQQNQLFICTDQKPNAAKDPYIMKEILKQHAFILLLNFIILTIQIRVLLLTNNTIRILLPVERYCKW
jgi:hypothetical protein